MEHQLDVLVNDLVALGSAAGSSGMSAATSRELADVLATLRYTLDYRIANGKLPHLSGLVCTRLLSALLTLTDDTVRIRWSSVTAAPQADEAVILIGGFAKSGARMRQHVDGQWAQHEWRGPLPLPPAHLPACPPAPAPLPLPTCPPIACAYQRHMHRRLRPALASPCLNRSVDEFREVLRAMPLSQLRSALKLHTRFHAEATAEQREAAVALLQLLHAIYPGSPDWRDLVDDEEDAVQAFMEARLGSAAAPRDTEIAFPRMPALPPPAGTFADRHAAAVLGMFATTVDGGLTGAEAAARVARYGRNVIPPPARPSPWRMIWAQLTDFIVLVLLVGAALSAGFQKFDVRLGSLRVWMGRVGRAARQGAERLNACPPARALSLPFGSFRLCMRSRQWCCWRWWCSMWRWAFRKSGAPTRQSRR